MSSAAPPGAEEERVREAEAAGVPWRRCRPSLSDRQWGSVREDDSADGDAWSYLNRDQSRSRAYRWGEDGIAGFSEDEQHLCLAMAMWSGRDSILEERSFGVTSAEGNHGEDVKEHDFHLDGTPPHSSMRMLDKYPQTEYPYADHVATNRRLTLEVARELSQRLMRIFLADPEGRRPCHGGQRIFVEAEHSRDLVTFSEYVHGDDGAGLGPSHQTGWTGLVAVLPNLFVHLAGRDLLHGAVSTGGRAGTDGRRP